MKGRRHASCAEASLRVLELLQAHPPFIEKDRFTLAAGRHVNAAQLARLVDAARAMCLFVVVPYRCVTRCRLQRASSEACLG